MQAEQKPSVAKATNVAPQREHAADPGMRSCGGITATKFYSIRPASLQAELESKLQLVPAVPHAGVDSNRWSAGFSLSG